MLKKKFLPFGFLPLLLIPLIAMQFTEEVNWSIFDFFIMGFLLILVGFGTKFIIKKNKPNTKRWLLISLLYLLFLMIWAELAVGVFGSVFAGN